MNVGQWTTQWAKLQPDEPCIKSGDTELSKREFNHRINRLCSALLEAGITKGDRVAGLMANGNVFLEIFFAVSKLGAIMVPLNFRLAPAELVFILKDSSPSMLIYSPEFGKLVEALRGKMPGVKKIVCEMQGGAVGDGEYEAWIEGYIVAEPEVAWEVNMEDPHLIIYTSGTTGKPKGAVIAHANTQWNAVHYLHNYRCDHSHVTACCAPFFHVGGLLCSAVPNIYTGAKLVIQRFFDPAGILKLIQENRVNSMLGIPVMYMLMAQTPEFAEADLTSIEYFIAGGSPCSKSLIETYQQKGTVFSQGYGMSEAPVITTLRPEDCMDKIGSSGKPMFHMSVRLVDDQGNEVPVGETGEILSKGPVVIPQYWRNPEATAATIENGWIHTGDMGCFDADGFLYIKDRKKDMYISGGENVYPAEVENVIMGFSGVADVAVIGMPDEKWGETGMAIVIKAPGVEITDQEIIASCRGRLAAYKIPKKVVFTDELPKTPSGKPLKKALRARYLQA
jgi:fatty-acyl-CoA synthase